MAQKYKVGYRSRRSKRLIILAVVIIVAGAGLYAVYVQFRKSTQVVIKNSAGTSQPFDIPNSKTLHYDQGFFGFDAPSDWKLIKHDTAPYDLYSYRSTLKNADNRYLDIYADKIPLTLAVNKSVAVRTQGGILSHGMVSENCTSFNTAPPRTVGGSQALTVNAKWDGVVFVCDLDNINRNAVGTSAADSINKVTLTGPTNGSHSYFFVYNDNNYTPDYTIFYNILESFIAK